MRSLGRAFLFFEGRAESGQLPNWEKGQCTHGPILRNQHEDESGSDAGRDLQPYARGRKPVDTLMNVVALIATRFRTDVCSAYLLEPDRSNLVLAATLGLHPK